MKSIISLTIILVLCMLSSFCSSAFVKRHDFPAEDENGKQLANEFQLIRPENIIIAQPSPLADTYTISVSPTLISNDEEVVITYYSSNPKSTDWIGAYSPADVSLVTTNVPVKYGYCDDSSSYLSTGYGSLKFNMTNLRDDIAFYYFTGSLSSPVLQKAADQVVKFKNINEPLRPRVIATGNPNIFNLLWSSATSTKPTLKWGVASGAYSNIISATTSTIPKTYMCGSPANGKGWRDLGLIHTAALIGMQNLANQRLYYVFGDDATNDYSKEYIFQVPPLAGTQPKNRPTRVIIYDDLGRGTLDESYTWNEYGKPAIYTSMAVGHEVSLGTVDAVYHGGDISYATGYMAVWDFMMDMISPVSSGALYFTTVGNHESDWTTGPSIYKVTDSGGECGVAATTLFPEPAPATVNAPWWSYDIGIIHFIGMSTEHDFSTTSAQYAWLENDLKNVNRTATPWIIFGGHRAMYLNSNYGGNSASDINVMDQLILYIEPLLFKYQVNFGFYGHNHVVQRQAAVYNKVVIQHSVLAEDEEGNTIHLQSNPQATVHMVIGTAGASFTQNSVVPYPDWNEMSFYEWGYSQVTAVNASCLQIVWVNAESGQVRDRLTITQEFPLKPWSLSSASYDEKYLRGSK